MAQVAPSMVDPALPQRQVNEEELRVLASNLPSQFQPFEGLKFPLSSNQNLFRSDRKNGEQPAQQPTGKKQFIQMPDRLGLSSRLSCMMPSVILWSVRLRMSRSPIVRLW